MISCPQDNEGNFCNDKKSKDIQENSAKNVLVIPKVVKASPNGDDLFQNHDSDVLMSFNLDIVNEKGFLNPNPIYNENPYVIGNLSFNDQNKSQINHPYITEDQKYAQKINNDFNGFNRNWSVNKNVDNHPLQSYANTPNTFWNPSSIIENSFYDGSQGPILRNSENVCGYDNVLFNKFMSQSHTTNLNNVGLGNMNADYVYENSQYRGMFNNSLDDIGNLRSDQSAPLSGFDKRLLNPGGYGFQNQAESSGIYSQIPIQPPIADLNVISPNKDYRSFDVQNEDQNVLNPRFNSTNRLEGYGMAYSNQKNLNLSQSYNNQFLPQQYKSGFNVEISQNNPDLKISERQISNVNQTKQNQKNSYSAKYTKDPNFKSAVVEFNRPAINFQSSLLNKTNVIFKGCLESMMTNWNSDERRVKRRLVQFWKFNEANNIICSFSPMHSYERNTSNIVISCIYWEAQNDYFITSVDCIHLLESLISVRFSVEEKNRIRRNLEGFRPLTASKAKSESSDFYKLIMSYPNPKPRNIEKDVKVFKWKSLSSALIKIIGKYTSSCTASRKNLLKKHPEKTELFIDNFAANNSQMHSDSMDRNPQSILHLRDSDLCSNSQSLNRPSSSTRIYPNEPISSSGNPKIMVKKNNSKLRALNSMKRSKKRNHDDVINSNSNLVLTDGYQDNKTLKPNLELEFTSSSEISPIIMELNRSRSVGNYPFLNYGLDSNAESPIINSRFAMVDSKNLQESTSNDNNIKMDGYPNLVQSVEYLNTTPRVEQERININSQQKNNKYIEEYENGLRTIESISLTSDFQENKKQDSLDNLTMNPLFKFERGENIGSSLGGKNDTLVGPDENPQMNEVSFKKSELSGRGIFQENNIEYVFPMVFNGENKKFENMSNLFQKEKNSEYELVGTEETLELESMFGPKSKRNAISTSITDATSCSSINLFDTDMNAWNFQAFEEGSHESFSTTIGGLCKYPNESQAFFDYAINKNSGSKETDKKPSEFNLNQNFRMDEIVGNQV
ncbi:hypothetical protein AYI68_g3042 [Smittium mucronatum]|uniref:DUF7082 domain-containing protein n=1 Tax=Smittium mucronatum TaxID=133383 RepID=A0A1R0H103_9FUNG|nr:hypothetical protein AYI68_g3042 [Smittium mucronatum]